MHLYIVHVLFDNLLPLEICRLFLLTWFFLSCVFSGVAKVKRTQEITHDLFAVSSSSGYVIASYYENYFSWSIHPTVFKKS
jgi:hypothetical protein